jgi:hypothetical protein
MVPALIAELRTAVLDLLYDHNCQVLDLPDVRAHLDPVWAMPSPDPSSRRRTGRLCREIRAIGEELHRIGGREAMLSAISVFETSNYLAFGVIDSLWNGIGGCWFR